MNAKEAKIIQEGNIGEIIKEIRKLIERCDYNQWGELRTNVNLSPNQINALEELGYTVYTKETVGWYNTETIIGW
jgi:hypothetical protein